MRSDTAPTHLVEHPHISWVTYEHMSEKVAEGIVVPRWIGPRVRLRDELVRAGRAHQGDLNWPLRRGLWRRGSPPECVDRLDTAEYLPSLGGSR